MEIQRIAGFEGAFEGSALSSFQPISALKPTQVARHLTRDAGGTTDPVDPYSQS